MGGETASKRSLVSSTSIAGGLVGGIVHTAVAASLWNAWFDDLRELLATKPLDGAYLLLGMFLLGFVPVLFYVGGRARSPLLVVAGCPFLAGAGSWATGPVLAPSAAPTPFALYVLLWVGIVAIATGTGGLELRRNRRTTT